MGQRRPGIVGVVLLLAASFLGLVGIAQATTVSTPGFTAKATATVTPTRLPADGTAPVTLTINSTATRPDPEALTAYPMSYVDLRLDRQLTVDTTGLPTCTSAALKGATPAVARQKCGTALIGSGGADVTLRPVIDEPTLASAHFDLLFFNARDQGRPSVLMYRSYSKIPQGIAWPIGTGRSLHVKDVGGEDNRIQTSTFEVRLGKTWRYKGKRHSYLNGRCATGTFKNSITLTLDSGTVSETVPQRCTKRAG